MSGSMQPRPTAPWRRRLPIIATPAPGEALRSWLLRTAALLNAPPGRVASATGLAADFGHVRLRSQFGVELPPNALAVVCGTTGLRPAEIDSMHLAHLGGVCLDLSSVHSSNPLGTRVWGWSFGSRYCSRCLKETGVWRLEWLLTATVLCPTHGTLLSETCPGCGLTPHAASHGGGAMGCSSREPQSVTQCGRPLGRSVCRQDLALVPGAPPAPGGLVRLELQLAEARRAGSVVLRGRNCSAQDTFRILVALAALVRFAGSIDMLPDGASDSLRDALAVHLGAVGGPAGGGDRLYRGRPHSVAATAAVLTILAPAMAAKSEGAFERALVPLLTAARTKRHAIGRNPLQGLEMPAAVAAWMQPPMPHARVVRRLLPNGSPRAVPSIPQVLPARWFRELAPLLPHHLERTARQFAALSVARWAGARSWAAAGEVTGVGGARGASIADTVTRELFLPNAYWEKVREVGLLVLAHDADWSLRRSRMRLHEVPRAAVIEALPQGAVWTAERGRHAATLVWVEWAGGIDVDSPAMACSRWRSSVASRRQGWSSWSRSVPDELAVLLMKRAADLHTAKHGQ